jgi:hypothetical protein
MAVPDTRVVHAPGHLHAHDSLDPVQLLDRARRLVHN